VLVVTVPSSIIHYYSKHNMTLVHHTHARTTEKAGRRLIMHSTRVSGGSAVSHRPPTIK
jgi:hypothetical protein